MTSLALVRLFCAICDALERRLIPGSVQLAGAAWVWLRNLPVLLRLGPPFWFRPPAGRPLLELLVTLRLWSPPWSWRLILPLRDLVVNAWELLARIRRRLPGWWSRFLRWLGDFLIDAFMILAGTAAICAMIWWFMYA